MTTVKIQGRDKVFGTISAGKEKLLLQGDIEKLKEVVASYYEKGDSREFVRSLPRHYRSMVQANITRDDDTDLV